MQIDICDKCHPFFTGEVKFVDRQGRVDRFLKKQQLATEKQSQTKQKKTAKAEASDQKSYRELLREQQAAMRQAAKKTDSAATPASK